VGRIYGLSDEEITRGIGNLESMRGRFRMIETADYLVVDDSYNASPASMKASMDIMKDADGRKVAVLGDMGELGKDEKEMHREVGRYASSSGIDLLICTGTLSREMAEAALACRDNPTMVVVWEPDRESLLAHIENYLKKGDTVLVKASHFMHFEQVVDLLTGV